MKIKLTTKSCIYNKTFHVPFLYLLETDRCVVVFPLQSKYHIKGHGVDPSMQHVLSRHYFYAAPSRFASKRLAYMYSEKENKKFQFL